MSSCIFKLKSSLLKSNQEDDTQPPAGTFNSPSIHSTILSTSKGAGSCIIWFNTVQPDDQSCFDWFSVEEHRGMQTSSYGQMAVDGTTQVAA